MIIEESGMKFGPYPESECFYIENSKIYEEIKDNVKMAEFILLHNKKVFVIEAKKSTPNPNNSQTDFKIFIKDIHDKLSNALYLWFALHLNRHPNKLLPQAFQELNLANVEFRLVLVVNEHRKDWLPPLQNALQKSLNPIIKIWGLSAITVQVMNDKLAHKHKLITSE